MKAKFISGKRKFSLSVPTCVVIFVLCRIIKKSKSIQIENLTVKELKKLLKKTIKSAKKIMPKSEFIHVYSKGKTEFCLSF